MSSKKAAASRTRKTKKKSDDEARVAQKATSKSPRKPTAAASAASTAPENDDTERPSSPRLPEPAVVAAPALRAALEKNRDRRRQSQAEAEQPSPEAAESAAAAAAATTPSADREEPAPAAATAAAAAQESADQPSAPPRTPAAGAQARTRKPKRVRRVESEADVDDEDEDTEDAAPAPPALALVELLITQFRKLNMKMDELTRDNATLRDQNAAIMDLLQTRIDQEDWFADLQCVVRDEIKAQFRNVKYLEHHAPQPDQFRHDAGRLGYNAFFQHLVDAGHVGVPQRVLPIVQARLQSTATDTLIRLRRDFTAAIRHAVLKLVFEEKERGGPYESLYVEAKSKECKRAEWTAAWRQRLPDADSIITATTSIAEEVVVDAIEELKWGRPASDSDIAFGAFVVESMFGAVNLVRTGGGSHYGNYKSWLSGAKVLNTANDDPGAPPAAPPS